MRPGDLIAPLFVKESIADPVPVASMPGQSQHTLESLRKEAVEIAERGVRAFILFAVPATKDAEGSGAWNPEGIGQQAVAALRGVRRRRRCDRRPLPRRVHRPRALRRAERPGRGRQRRDGRALPADRDRAGERRRPSRRTERHDGRPGRRDARRWTAPASGRRDPRVRGQVRERPVRPVREAAEGAPSFGDRTGYQEDPANERRSARPDRHRRGGRHRDGEAGLPIWT